MTFAEGKTIVNEYAQAAPNQKELRRHFVFVLLVTWLMYYMTTRNTCH